MATNQTADVYFVDKSLMRLLPAKIYLPDVSTEKAAKKVIEELIKGRDTNPKILRLIPNSKRCMTVKVENDTAYVNLTKKLIKEHPDGANQEILTVYAIVNSLTSIDGIKKVKFTIDGKEKADFKGNIDMRETFVPDFNV